MKANRGDGDKSFRMPADKKVVGMFQEQALAPAQLQNADVPAVLRFSFHFLYLSFLPHSILRVCLRSITNCILVAT